MDLPTQPYDVGVGLYPAGILNPVTHLQPPSLSHTASGPQESDVQL